MKKYLISTCQEYKDGAWQPAYRVYNAEYINQTKYPLGLGEYFSDDWPDDTSGAIYDLTSKAYVITRSSGWVEKIYASSMQQALETTSLERSSITAIELMDQKAHELYRRELWKDEEDAYWKALHRRQHVPKDKYELRHDFIPDVKDML